jgi:polyphosphate glucokinase
MNNNILTIDIGGSSIKATVLNEKGEMLVDYQKKATPDQPNPSNVLKAIKILVSNFPEYSKISIGFPCYVKDGVVFTAPNLGNKQWKGCEFAQIIANQFEVPVRLLNDADLQGFGLIEGDGLELILTLGTGLGTALFVDGVLMPHLELSHFKIRTNKDAFIGNDSFEKMVNKNGIRNLKKS